MKSNYLGLEYYRPEIRIRKRKINEYLYKVKGINVDRTYYFKTRKDMFCFYLFETNCNVIDIQEYYPINIDNKVIVIDLLVTFINNRKLAFFSNENDYKEVYRILKLNSITPYIKRYSDSYNRLMDIIENARLYAVNEYNKEKLVIVYLLVIKGYDIVSIASLINESNDKVLEMIYYLSYVRKLPFKYMFKYYYEC